LKEIRCLKCGTLLVSGDLMQALREKIADDEFSLGGFVVTCPKCFSQFGVVVASDSQMTMVLLVPPEKTNECFLELKEMLQQGLSLAVISQMINNSRKPQYISFL